MNRIIVIGNGFDKAHGLATGYKDFIDDYWTDFSYHFFNGYSRFLAESFGSIHIKPYEDEFARLEVLADKGYITSDSTASESCLCVYDEIKKLIEDLNNSGRYEGTVRLTFKNQFFEHISSRCTLTNWLDIENEYYGQLRKLLEEDDSISRNQKVRKLNQDFSAVKNRLETYLKRIIDEAQIRPIEVIKDIFDSDICSDEVAYSKRELFISAIRHQLGIYNPMQKNEFLSGKDYKIDQTLILNFNYTSVAKDLYAKMQDEIVNIHGELGNNRNPIIFGYGDELDDDYKRIERLQDNDFLENIKSVKYHETGNYRQLLGFIESAPYQVLTLGHSCGNSDRTLLNTLFEHPNCISVKVYYHQREDGTDDYSQLIRNISRNFNDKAAMRDKVVNKERCLPLRPCK